VNTLLTTQFIAHYALTGSIATAPFKETKATYFELKDDATLIYYNVGDGIAPHKNNSNLQVKVVNYEAFHTDLPATFRHGKKICDLVVYTSLADNYFSLCELTDTASHRVPPFTDLGGNAFPGKRSTAQTQLTSTLTLLSAVTDIKVFMAKFTIKRCCFFNKQATPIPAGTVTITAPTTFSRVNTITEEGFEMSHPAIEALGFTLFEYSGGKAAKIA